jgi:esterase/lipase superfamily enzyme
MAAASGLVGAGCSMRPEPLMETPVLFHDAAETPCAGHSDAGAEAAEGLFYATTRERGNGDDGHGYTAAPADRMSFGRARIRLGPEGTDWSFVDRLSVTEERPEQYHLDFLWAFESAAPRHDALPALGEDPALDAFLVELDAAIAASSSGDLLVYVHGTKVDFTRPLMRSAELAHYAGNRFPVLVFGWPAHGNILSYVFGSDREHAEGSSVPLEGLLELLAERTHAGRIHVLAYSAGCETASRALESLRGDHADARRAERREKLRIGTVVLASGDVERHAFDHRAPAIHDLAERLVVYMSDSDSALEAAEKWMTAGTRLGDDREPLDAQEVALYASLPRLELVDVSAYQLDRGFDITGHHYWYRHPWVSSDLLTLLCMGLEADKRGLIRHPKGHSWGYPPDFPERVRAAWQANVASHPPSRTVAR